MLDKNQVINICKQYKILSSFKKYHRNYYDRALKLGVFKEATEHMIRGVKCGEEIVDKSKPKVGMCLLQDYWSTKSDQVEFD